MPPVSVGGLLSTYSENDEEVLPVHPQFGTGSVPVEPRNDLPSIGNPKKSPRSEKIQETFDAVNPSLTVDPGKRLARQRIGRIYLKRHFPGLSGS